MTPDMHPGKETIFNFQSTSLYTITPEKSSEICTQSLAQIILKKLKFLPLNV